MTLRRHFLLFAILVGFTTIISLYVFFIAARLLRLESPYNLLAVIGGTALVYFLARFSFASRVPARCPDCGGDAYLSRASRFPTYTCTACHHRHSSPLKFG
jgi:hypothetical protein